LALAYVDNRDQLDVLEQAEIDKILACRGRARTLLEGRDDFVTFDEPEFSPARTVAANIIHGNRRYDRRAGWKTLDKMLSDAIDEAGLRDDLIALGLGRPLSSGGGLSTSVRRRIGLIRAMVKRPSVLVLDGVAGSDNAVDAALRTAIRADLPEATVLYAAAEGGATTGADLVITIADNGEAVCAEAENPAQLT
ncbi:MAG: hypothetical protein AAGB15_06610, partial [Pseudomonadota bacterium]